MNIVFDLGAVVFRFEPLRLVAELWPEREAMAALTRSIFGPHWVDFDRGAASVDEVVRNVAVAAQVDEQRMRRLVDEVGARLEPMQDTAALLPRLKTRGHRLLYLSNMPAPYVDGLSTRGGVLSRFDGGVFSCTVGVVKPEPEIFREVERRFGADAASMLFIDDSLHNVDAAKAVGWQAFQFIDAAQCETELQRRGLL